MVIVGAGRTANGDVANKIGIFCCGVGSYHHVPFYVAAPLSTFDLSLSTGQGFLLKGRRRNEEMGRISISPKMYRSTIRHLMLRRLI